MQKITNFSIQSSKDQSKNERPVLSSEDKNSLFLSENSEFIEDSKKKARRYANITKEKRKRLIEMIINSKTTIIQAAKTLRIKLSTAKAILRTYRNEGRIGKKPT